MFFFGGKAFWVVVFCGKFGDEIGEKRGCTSASVFFLSRGEHILVGRNEEKSVKRGIYRYSIYTCFFVRGIGAHVVIRS